MKPKTMTIGHLYKSIHEKIVYSVQLITKKNSFLSPEALGLLTFGFKLFDRCA